MTFLNRLYAAVVTSTGATLPADFVRAIKEVKSISECISALENSGLLSAGTLSEEASSLLFREASLLRENGMALEPNLLGRAAVMLISNHSQAAAAAEVFASQDTDFQGFFKQGDEHRDRNSFVESEYCYFRCLQLYPPHISATVQYAHSLKEQEKYFDSLVKYLDAATLGAPLDHVEEHALFVAERVGLILPTLKRLTSPQRWILSSEVFAVEEILLGSRSSLQDCLQLMLRHEGITQLIPTLASSETFARANKNLLKLISERGI
jgi:hypothetical protein